MILRSETRTGNATTEEGNDRSSYIIAKVLCCKVLEHTSIPLPHYNYMACIHVMIYNVRSSIFDSRTN